jgi:hypothetical protein
VSVEVLCILNALSTGKLCAVSVEPRQPTLRIAA